MPPARPWRRLLWTPVAVGQAASSQSWHTLLVDRPRCARCSHLLAPAAREGKGEARFDGSPPAFNGPGNRAAPISIRTSAPAGCRVRQKCQAQAQCLLLCGNAQRPVNVPKRSKPLYCLDRTKLLSPDCLWGHAGSLGTPPTGWPSGACSAEMLSEYMEQDGEPAQCLMAAYAKLRTGPCCTQPAQLPSRGAEGGLEGSRQGTGAPPGASDPDDAIIVATRVVRSWGTV